MGTKSKRPAPANHVFAVTAANTLKIDDDEYGPEKLAGTGIWLIRKYDDDYGREHYIVDTRSSAIVKCTCPDAKFRGRECKHWHGMRYGILEGLI